jgi:hypothetical protein
MLCQDDVALGEFLILQCAANYFLDRAHQLMYVHDQFLDHYIIKRHVSHAWYGCWTIKALVEAEVL